MTQFPSFGFWVRRRRKALDLTQTELARQVACALVTIKKIELDERRPSRLMAERLASCLQIQPEERLAFIQAARGELSAIRLPEPSIGVEEVHTNLPLPATRLIGRLGELAEIQRTLSSTSVRLLTLTGFGGVGKTRLALQAATDSIQAFVDGVFFIDLAPLSEGELVLRAVSSALGIREAPRRSLEQTLIAFLRHKRMLLLLDNCEHLVEACAYLVNTLLNACQYLKVMATSRQPLRLPGEYILLIQPLPVLDPQLQLDFNTFSQNEAVRLFTERATAIRADFALTDANAHSVSETCARLDGIPLAIELAAARINVLSPEQITARLDDGLRLLSGGSRASPARHQTLRATIDWSYALLTRPEQTLFIRLGIFNGSCSLDAVESICSEQDGRVKKEEVLDLLSGLVNHSLVRVVKRGGQLRYRMLDTLLGYAQERLIASGDLRALQLRHIDYYCALVETAEARFHGQEQVIWFNRLELEGDNLRLALENALEMSGQVGCRMVIALWYFWLVRGYSSEGVRWVKRYLEVLGDLPNDCRVKVDLLCRAASLSVQAVSQSHQHDLALVDQGLELAYSLEDDQRIAFALYIKGWIERIRGNSQLALEMLERALAYYRDLKDDWGIAHCLYALGIVYEVLLSDREMAAHYHRESLQICRQAGYQRGTALAINNLGNIAFDEGDLETAQKCYEESLMISRQTGAHSSIASILCNLGNVVLRDGKTVEARQLFEESIFINKKVGYFDVEYDNLWSMGNLERLEGRCLLARERLNQALQVCKEYEMKHHIGPLLADLGKVECTLGNHVEAAALLADALQSISASTAADVDLLDALEAVIGLIYDHQLDDRATRLLGAVDGLRVSRHLRRYPIYQTEIEPIQQGLLNRLGEAGFAAAYNQGQALTLEEAVKEAQDVLSRLITIPAK